MSPSNDRHQKIKAVTRTVGAAIATAGLLFTSAASVAASGAAEGAGHPQANVALDQTGCGLIPLDVELIIDRSGSMGDNSTDGHTRMYWAQHAADQLVDSLEANGGVGTDQNHRVGVTSFHNTTAHVDLALDGASASTVKSAINGLTSSGNTPLAAGMAAGAGDMAANGRDTDFGLSVQHVIIIMSDGRPWPDGAPARPSAGQVSSFKSSAESIYSIAIGQGGTAGTANEVDLALMASLAKPASGYFNVVSASDLPALFGDIFSSIACRPGIQVDKSADTDSLPAGGGDVTYSYDVTNVGNVALSNVSVSDDKCSPVTYVSGDSDHDSKLGSRTRRGRSPARPPSRRRRPTSRRPPAGTATPRSRTTTTQRSRSPTRPRRHRPPRRPRRPRSPSQSPSDEPSSSPSDEPSQSPSDEPQPERLHPADRSSDLHAERHRRRRRRDRHPRGHASVHLHHRRRRQHVGHQPAAPGPRPRDPVHRSPLRDASAGPSTGPGRDRRGLIHRTYPWRSEPFGAASSDLHSMQGPRDRDGRTARCARLFACPGPGKPGTSGWCAAAPPVPPGKVSRKVRSGYWPPTHPRA